MFKPECFCSPVVCFEIWWMVELLMQIHCVYSIFVFNESSYTVSIYFSAPLKIALLYFSVTYKVESKKKQKTNCYIVTSGQPKRQRNRQIRRVVYKYSSLSNKPKQSTPELNHGSSTRRIKLTANAITNSKTNKIQNLRNKPHVYGISYRNFFSSSV